MSVQRLVGHFAMQRLQAERFIAALTILASVESDIRGSLTHLRIGDRDEEEAKSDDRLVKAWAFAKTKLEHLSLHCDAYDIRVTALFIKRLLGAWKDDLAKDAPLQAAGFLGDVASRTYDELSLKTFFVLSASEADMFKGDYFPPGVLAAFPGATEDLEESTKCIALGRYTAAVFHLMRAMEFAVQALAAKLQITNVEREWGKLLSDVSKKIEPMPKGSERDLWSESHTHLYHVKQAWRNDVMHPKATYTEEQAEDVLRAVRSFMKHLASLVS